MSDTRGLSDDERAILTRMLPPRSFAGSDALARQLPSTSVVCGSPPNFLDLVVDETAPAASIPDGPVPLRGLVMDDASGELAGEILVWVERGRLSGLEHAWFSPEVPTSLPRPERLQVKTGTDR